MNLKQGYTDTAYTRQLQVTVFSSAIAPDACEKQFFGVCVQESRWAVAL